MKMENFLTILRSKTNPDLPLKTSFEKGFELFYNFLIDTFKRKEEEVAIFILDDRNILKFLYPIYLRKAGAIPKDYKKSFVWRLINAQKGIIDNDFKTAIHLNFFENAKEKNKSPEPIEKIMGLPLIKNDKVYGAIEISKKGKDEISA